MENKLFTGDIINVRFLNGTRTQEVVKKTVLYQDSDALYTDLDTNISYYVFKETDRMLGYFISASSLIKTDSKEYKKDYLYLVQKHLDGPIKVTNESGKRRGIRKKV